MIIALGPSATEAALTATASTGAPIVSIGDVVAAGHAAQLGRPGGRVTGLSFLPLALNTKRLALLAELLPKGSAVLNLIDLAPFPTVTQAVQDAGRQLGLVPHAAVASTPAEVGQAYVRAQALRVGGVNVLALPFHHGLRAMIMQLALRARLPAIYQWPETAREGGLLGYGPSSVAMFRQLAGYAARILRGAKPADLPIEQPTRFDPVINLKAARARPDGAAVNAPARRRGGRMRQRRDLLGLLVASCGWPLGAWPQARPLRIGYISVRMGPNEFEQAFLRGLRERGWVEGENLIIDFRWAAFDRQRVPAMVTELLALQPALMVVADAGGARAMIRSQNPAMPIVAPAFGDPIAQGVTSNLARPDGNATGTSVFATELAHKRLELLKEAVPGMRRAAALYDATIPPAVGVAVSVNAGKDLGIEVAAMPVRLPEGIDAAFAAAVRQGVQGVAIVSSTATITYRAPLCELSLAHRLPTIFANRTYLKAGGLMSYGPDLEAAFHRGAYFVDRILKGAKPAELPIEQPSTFQLVLNQRTARALAVKFPQSLLLRADEVIE